MSETERPEYDTNFLHMDSDGIPLYLHVTFEQPVRFVLDQEGHPSIRIVAASGFAAEPLVAYASRFHVNEVTPHPDDAHWLHDDWEEGEPIAVDWTSGMTSDIDEGQARRGPDELPWIEVPDTNILSLMHCPLLG